MRILKLAETKVSLGPSNNYTLIPDQNWEIISSFIDQQSGLLIVTTSFKSGIKNDFNVQTDSELTVKHYVIDPEKLEILPPTEWSTRFSYSPVEYFSDDQAYKLITTRIHHPDQNTDSVKEVLVDNLTQKTISASTRRAFTKEKWEDALQKYVKEKAHSNQQKNKQIQLPQRDQRAKSQSNQNGIYSPVFNYRSADYVYELRRKKLRFVLLKCTVPFSSNSPFDIQEFREIESYSHLKEFEDRYLKQKAWFMVHFPYQRTENERSLSTELAHEIVHFFNDLRAQHDFTYLEYRQIQVWEHFIRSNSTLKSNAFKQFCGRCKRPVNYVPRYPKYLCVACCSSRITDEHGSELLFSNVGLGGGLRIIYKKGDKVIKEETDQWKKLCFIEGQRFSATEAKFGGVVIQNEH